MTELGLVFQEEGHKVKRAPGASPDGWIEYTIVGVSPYWFYRIIKDMGFEFVTYVNYAATQPGAAHQIWAADDLQLEIYQGWYERQGDVTLLANKELV